MTAGIVSTLHDSPSTASGCFFFTFFFFVVDEDLLVNFFGSFGIQIFSTSAERSSGGVRASDIMSLAVPFTVPDRIF